jgi:GNAT superfamily N-acetyltransferase
MACDAWAVLAITIGESNKYNKRLDIDQLNWLEQGTGLVYTYVCRRKEETRDWPRFQFFSLLLPSYTNTFVHPSSLATTMPFTLTLATPEDASAMAGIFKYAFASDTHTQVKLLGTSIEEMVDGMKSALDSWIIKTDKCTVTKAVEDGTGELMGWVCWGHHGFEDTSVDETIEAKGSNLEKEISEGDVAAESVQDKSEESEGRKSEENQRPPLERNTLEDMERLTDEDMERWMEKVMPKGTKCLYIASLLVHPDFQSRGVGSALIKREVEHADRENVFAWVHASEAGYHLFDKSGFQVEETLELDLDKYAPDPPPPTEERKHWGHYTFRYMVRQPMIKQ